MFIYDSNRYAKDPGGISKLADDLIAKHGGEILVSRLWNEQRLAYPIAVSYTHLRAHET